MPTKPELTAADPPGFYYAATHNAPYERQPVYWDGQKTVDVWSGETIPNPTNFSGPLTGPLIQFLRPTVEPKEYQ
jgi:hypothetical protein